MSDEKNSVIVIGSGPTGAIAALKLIERGIPVTMLESGCALPKGLLVRVMGRNIFRKIPPLNVTNKHLPSADPQTEYIYSLEPGGLSNHWTGAVPRFAPEDFYEGERLHERYRWPVSYQELVPYYEQIEKLLVISGGGYSTPNLPESCVAIKRFLPAQWQNIAALAEKNGYGLIPALLADGPEWMLKRTARSFNSFTDIIERLQKSPHFKLILGAHVTRLEWSGQKKKVEAVIYRDKTTGADKRIGGAAVVVAAGALATTGLLLNSTSSDFPNGLGNTNNLLGYYLHDHPTHWFVLELDKTLQRLSHPAYLTRGSYLDAPPLLGASFTFGEFVNTRIKKAISLTPIKTNRFSVNSFSTMIPLAENYVNFDNSTRDEFGFPQLDIHIQFRQEVRDFMTKAREQVLDLMDAAGYKGRVEKLVIKPPGASVHYGGTVRMHSSPEYGMLDRWNRLNEVKNVVVVDASCFTTGPEKNPTLTAMALAARASDYLAENLKHSCL